LYLFKKMLVLKHTIIDIITLILKIEGVEMLDS